MPALAVSGATFALRRGVTVQRRVVSARHCFGRKENACDDNWGLRSQFSRLA